MGEQVVRSREVEEFITEFLASLGRIHRRFAVKSVDLSQSVWSEVTSTLDVGEFNADEPDHYVAIWAYVDGELEGVGGVAWQLEASRRGTGWEVERVLTLNANDARHQTTAAELPVAVFPDSRALVEGLPRLAEELLQLPAPQAP